MKFTELLETGRFELVNDHLALLGGGVPWSITEEEFNYITKFIIENKLKNGYELATGFGISALAAGLGFKEIGGRLISIDSYIEGQLDTLNYKQGLDTYPESECYHVACYLMEKYGLDNVVLGVGWSPQDIPTILEKEVLDYAFIDGTHTANQVKKDIKVLEKFMGDGYMFFHDVEDGRLRNAIVEQLNESFNSDLVRVLPNLGLAKIHGLHT